VHHGIVPDQGAARDGLVTEVQFPPQADGGGFGRPRSQQLVDEDFGVPPVEGRWLGSEGVEGVPGQEPVPLGGQG
jgi:hypothetical protein